MKSHAASSNDPSFAAQEPPLGPTQYPLPRPHDALVEFQPTAQRYEGGRDEHSLEILARQAHVPMEHVTQLYTHALATLTVGARITGFLPLLALKKVRQLLRQASHTARRPGPHQDSHSQQLPS